METEVTATTCVIYVGRTEMESRHRWGKVGRVKEEARLDGRVHEYKTADRDFWFVYRAAFEVSLPVGMTPHTFETSVQARLAYRGIRRRGEQFLPPSGSMELLVRAVEIEIKQFGFPYDSLDIKAMKEASEARNLKVTAELEGIEEAAKACPIRAFLDSHQVAPWGARLRRLGQREKELMTFGHILRDLAAGSDLTGITLHYGEDSLEVFPTSLRAACFQAGAEADLVLPTTLRFCARPKEPGDLAFNPVAMRVRRSSAVDEHVDCFEVPGPFMTGQEENGEVPFEPEHLACLAEIGADGDLIHYYGLGTSTASPKYI